MEDEAIQTERGCSCGCIILIIGILGIPFLGIPSSALIVLGLILLFFGS